MSVDWHREQLPWTGQHKCYLTATQPEYIAVNAITMPWYANRSPGLRQNHYDAFTDPFNQHRNLSAITCCDGYADDPCHLPGLTLRVYHVKLYPSDIMRWS